MAEMAEMGMGATDRHRSNGRLRVIGIGNADRGDDAVGLAVVRALAADPGPAADPGEGGATPEFLEHDGELADLVETIGEADTVLIVDAALSGGRPGTIIRLDAADGPLPIGAFQTSTHALGLAEAVELARALGTLPAVCRVHAIEAADFTPGAPMTPEVAAAVAPAAERLRAELAALGAGKSPAGEEPAGEEGEPSAASNGSRKCTKPR